MATARSTSIASGTVLASPVMRTDDATDPSGLRWVPCGTGTRRVADAGTSVRVGDAHFAFEAVGVPEEERQDGTEVGHEVVSRTPRPQPAPDGLEGLQRPGLQGQVIDATPPEHR